MSEPQEAPGEEGARRDQALGRVLDPAALAESGGPRGRVRVEVPASWLAVACRIEIAVPRRLACARCDGGGCDGCGRSGVLRAPDEAAARLLSATLPGSAGAGVALRLTAPFGPDGVEQLIVEIRAGVDASPGVVRIEEPPPPPRPAAIPWAGIAAAIAAVGAILAAWLSR